MSLAAQIFSVEFFPPRTAAGRVKLDRVHEELTKLGPAFFSVTHGASGSAKAGTRELVLDYFAAGSEIAPHLTSTGADLGHVRELLTAYHDAGIRRLVVLRGDRPADQPSRERAFHARHLVEFVRAECGDHFHIEVACYPETHPESPSYAMEIEHFRQKIDAGANSAITQYFFNADAYFRFVEAAADAGVAIPIVPGIMPITNFAKLTAFSAKCGAEIPVWLGRRLVDFGDDQQGLRSFGEEVVTGLCERLLRGGAPGLHFYSLNLAGPVRGIWENLGLRDLSRRR